MKHYKHVRIRERQRSASPIQNTRRVERTLKLVALLSDWHSNKEMADHIGVHLKSINRYLNMLTELGFTVQWSWKGRYNYYRIANAKEYFNLE